MAKAKSKKITLEEALVPIEEQEYSIPNNWIWIYQNFVCQLSNGEKTIGEEYPYLEVKYLRGNTDAEIKDSGRFITANTKVILVDGENSGEVFEVLENGYMGSTFKALNISQMVNEKYLLYYVNSKRELLRKNKTGSAIPHLNKKLFFSLGFPLPPLPEQQRIVEQIESLFAKLDEAKEKAQEVIDGVETNIEAVLYNAFSGKLTQYWRKENSVDYNWENSTLSKIVSGLKYGSSEKSDYNNNGTPVLRIPNIGEGVIDFSDLKYMQGELGNSYHEVFENDILIIRSNGSRDLVGKCAIVPALERRYAYASFLIRIKASDKVLPKYLVRYINSSMARGQLFAKAKSSSGIHNINSKELGSIRIDVPTIEEQTEILKIIEPLIKKELDVKDITSNMIENIAELKKSILAKAFRGELGTNVLSEENSIELIKKMIGRDKIERKD